MLKIDGKVDLRHVVDIDNGSLATAIVLNNDGTYSRVTYMDNDDMRTWNNICEIDATPEELESYRKYKCDFRNGDQVQIVSGRKMKGETKTVDYKYTVNIEQLYQHGHINYLRFTDGTAVQAKHCIIL